MAFNQLHGLMEYGFFRIGNISTNEQKDVHSMVSTFLMLNAVSNNIVFLNIRAKYLKYLSFFFVESFDELLQADKKSISSRTYIQWIAFFACRQ